jgi:WD40 repeat protein
VPSLELEAELPGHEAPGYWVEIAPDGRHAASSAEDGTLRTWDLERGAALSTLDWSRTVAPCPRFAYGRDARWILFGATGRFGVVGIADAARGRVTGVWPVELRPIRAFTAWRGGEMIAAGDEDGDILVWRMPAAF